MMEIAINSVARMNGFTPSTIPAGGGYNGTPTKCNGKSNHIFTFSSASSTVAVAATSALSTSLAGRSSAVAKATAAGVSSLPRQLHLQKSKSTTAASAKDGTAIVPTTAAVAPTISTSSSSAVVQCGSVSATTTLSSSSSSSSSSTTTTAAITTSAAATPPPPPPTTTTTTTTATSTSTSKNHAIPSDILDDLASRFIINVPDDERTNLIRICFQIELAHWFYLDFFCAIEEKKLLPCGIKQFAMQLFQHIPFLRRHLSTIDKILEDWKNYKLSVPTYGAILISEDLSYVLLVQSYWAKSSWGFPKGKVNETEDPVHCATREVYEETGYDITGLIVPNDYIEAVINYQYTRLYIVRNVPLQTQFSPRTRNEIKCCDWFPIDSLPINKNDAISKTKLGLNANSFFMIMPFVKRLKKWVNDNRSGIETRRKYPPNNTSNSTTIVASASAGGGALSASPPNVGITSTVGGVGLAGVGVAVGANRGSPTSISKNNYTNISSSCKKDMDSNMRIYNENIALNNGNGSVSNNNSNSHTNTNHHHQQQQQQQSNGNGNGSSSRGNNKRQRHKSMGDIDGIKLNISNNTNSNNKSNQGGTKASNNGNNNGNKHAKVQQQQQLQQQQQQHQQQQQLHNGGSTSGATSSSVIPPKRQLFHSQSQSGTANMSSIYSDEWTNRKQQQQVISSFDLIRKEKQQQKEKEKEKNAPGNNNASSDKQLKKSNNFRTRTKSQGTSCNNNQATASISTTLNQTKQQQSVQLRTAKEKQQHQKQTVSITPPPSTGPAISISPKGKTRSVSLSIATTASSQKINNSITRSITTTPTTKTPQTTSNTSIITTNPTANTIPTATNQSNQILKFNPNFDSWTNFSFTKNFIANVFC